ncbi:MAG: hypothetical protein AAGA80_01510 [Cyanobacteria bacterium P01_F01_bin.143]
MRPKFYVLISLIMEQYPERTIRILGISYQQWQELTEVSNVNYMGN